MGKKITKILTGALLTAELLSSITGCGQDQKPIDANDLNPPAQSVNATQDEIHSPLRVNEITLVEDLNENYANTYSCQSINKLTKSLIYEIEELHKDSKKEVSSVITKELLTAIFMCESSFKTSVDVEDRKNDDYAGIGQTNRAAIFDALKRINDICKELEPSQIEKINNNYFVQIFKEFVGDPNKDYSKEQLTEATENVFAAIEANHNQNGAILGGAMSSMGLCAIAGNNWSAYENNPNLVVMSYYCGAGNMKGNDNKIGFLQSKLIDKKNKDHLEFNLDKLYTSGHTDEQIDKFQKGLIYMIKVINIKDTIIQHNHTNYKSDVQKIIEGIGTYKIGNWREYANNVDGITIDENILEQ